MVRSGVDEGIAIATANKRANRLRKAGAISDKAYSKHIRRRPSGFGGQAGART